MCGDNVYGYDLLLVHYGQLEGYTKVHICTMVHAIYYHSSKLLFIQLIGLINYWLMNLSTDLYTQRKRERDIAYLESFTFETKTREILLC